MLFSFARICLRDLKEKEHLLLPCFLADHDTAGSMILTNSAEESQLSQQVDIPTPLVIPPRSSPAQFSSPCLSVARSTQAERHEPVFVPITNNIDHDSPSNSPVIISKRMSSTSACLTEKQKEKLRARHAIPILCDDNSNTQSSLYAMDTPTIESMMATYQLRNASVGAKQSTNENSPSLFKQPATDASSSSSTIQSSQENKTSSDSSSSSSPPPPASTSMESTIDTETSPEQILSNSNDDDIPEESSISKKLRRSRRPSTSARKSLTINTRKKRSMLSSDDATTTTTTTIDTMTTTTAPSITIDSPNTTIEVIKARPLKGILKRLSPTKPRSDHTRHVAFHDQVKVLLFASPARRDPNSQLQKKKSPMRDETKPVSTITTRRSSAIHIQPPPPMETKTPSTSSILTEVTEEKICHSINYS